MRSVLLAISSLVIIGPHTSDVDPKTDPDDPPPLYSEQTEFGLLRIQDEERVNVLASGGVVVRDENGNPLEASYCKTRRFFQNGILYGSQIVEERRHILDDFQMIVASPWDAVAITGVTHAFDSRQVPLTYYHQSGPVGALFRELRVRKNGADAKAPVAILGLMTGTVAAYAARGQKFTFYETSPALKRLVADSDKYFSYISDARRRGAEIEIRVGHSRSNLKENRDRKFAILLVDVAESFPVPKDTMTKEGVQLYFERMTDDGILALHISNRLLRLEPMIAAIAAELNLTARVWNDDNERYRGKTASSWVILARKPEHLGHLFSPIGDLPFEDGLDAGANQRLRRQIVQTNEGRFSRDLMDLPITYCLIADYQKELDGKGTEFNDADDSRAAWLGWAQSKYASLCDPDGSQRIALFKALATRGGTPTEFIDGYRAWFDEKLRNPDSAEKTRLKIYIELFRTYGPSIILQTLMVNANGHAFRRLETIRDIAAWTDTDANVFVLVGDAKVQRILKFFGLPTPLQK